MNRPRTWAFVASAVVLGCCAGVAYVCSMANGIVAGALIGLPGREVDVAAAQRNAKAWLAATAMLVVASASAFYPLLRFGQEAAILVRSLSRIVVAVAIVASLAAVTVVVAIAGQFRHLLR